MSFITLILDWYNQHKRELPWRFEKKVYNVWLSEIILQQTRVSQGMDYYYRFISSFPDIQSLAATEEQQVLKLWQGLGYYSRARNLHKTAQIIVNEFNGNFPDTFKDLKKLPGIGPYTGAAIASICFNEKVPAIDGNAFRVYSRVFGIEKDISDSDAVKFYFEFAKKIMPASNAGDFNEAIMELGATVCLPQNPLCDICPVAQHCVALASGKIQMLPIKTKKVKVRKRTLHFYFIQHEENLQFLIQQRTGKDVWQHLFQLPLTETAPGEKSLLFSEFHPELVDSVTHLLTHQRLLIKFYVMKVSPTDFIKIANEFGLKAINPDEVIKYAFPKPIVSFLNNLFTYQY